MKFIKEWYPAILTFLGVAANFLLPSVQAFASNHPSAPGAGILLMVVIALAKERPSAVKRWIAPSSSSQKGGARIGAILLASTLSFCLIVAGCTVPAWVTTIENETPTIINAIGGLIPIIEVLSGTVLTSSQALAGANTLTKIQTDLTAAYSLAKGYQPATGVAANVEALLTDAQANIASLDTLIGAKDPKTQQMITNLLQDVANEVAMFGANAAQVASLKKFAASPARQPLGKFGFARAWNSHIVKTGNAAVDELSPRLRLPEHGTFIHIITLDRVK